MAERKERHMKVVVECDGVTCTVAREELDGVDFDKFYELLHLACMGVGWSEKLVNEYLPL